VHGRFAATAWVLALFAVERRGSAGDAAIGAAAPASHEAAPPRARGLRAIAALAAGLFALRTVHLAGELCALDGEARAIRSLLARTLPPRASLAVVWFFPSDRMATADRVRALATLHVPALAVVDRDANVPMLYALPGVQPIRYRGGLPRAHRFLPGEPGPDPSELAAAFDFVWLCGAPTALALELRRLARPVGAVGRCVLLATERDDVAVGGPSLLDRRRAARVGEHLGGGLAREDGGLEARLDDLALDTEEPR
jgi:hypothetical protein